MNTGNPDYKPYKIITAEMYYCRPAKPSILEQNIFIAEHFKVISHIYEVKFTGDCSLNHS